MISTKNYWGNVLISPGNLLEPNSNTMYINNNTSYDTENNKDSNNNNDQDIYEDVIKTSCLRGYMYVKYKPNKDNVFGNKLFQHVAFSFDCLIWEWD